MHISMSHWEISEINEEMYEVLKVHFLPMIQSFGATHCFDVQTSDKTFTLVTIYPDEAAFSAATKKIAELRSEASSTFGATLVKAEAGPVIAGFGG